MPADGDLTPAQQRVIAHRDGPLLVQAGPGSGKTTVLVRRACALLAAGEPPEGLWVVTFTVAAREQVRARLRQAAGPSGARVRCGTFHAYAYGLLREHGLGGRAPALLSEADRTHLLRRLLAAYAARARAAGDRAVEAEAGAVAALSAAVSVAAGTGAARQGGSLALVALARSAGLPGMGVPAEALGELLAGYRDAKAAEGVLDMDDLLWAALDLLAARPTVLAAQRERTRVVLVDEFQDLNLPQWQLVSELSPPGDRVMAVGDGDQAIYAFRGASPQWMREFPQRFPATTRIDLAENFRSRPAIIAVANRLIAHNRARLPFAGRSTRAAGSGAAVSTAGFRTAGAEAQAVAAEIGRRLAATGQVADMAVLYRTNAYPASLLHALARAGVAVRVLGGAVGAFDHWVARDILAYLQLAVDGQDAAALKRIANRPTRYISGRLLEQARAPDGGRAAAGGSRPGGAGRPLVDRLLALPDLPGWHRQKIVDLQTGLGMLARLVPVGAVRFVLADLGYLEFLKGRAGSAAGGDLGEWLAVAEELGALAAEAPDLPAFFVSLQAAAEEIARARGRTGAGVTLATCHAAKGLEFHTVFLVGCAEGLLPHRSALADPAALEEERRLCYVAFTRAKDELRISWVEGEAGGGPSRFLAEAGLAARAAAKPARRPRGRA